MGWNIKKLWANFILPSELYNLITTLVMELGTVNISNSHMIDGRQHLGVQKSNCTICLLKAEQKSQILKLKKLVRWHN